MVADAQFRDRVLELLSSLDGISSRSMFGGYGIFAGADMFALISGSALFFKVDESNRSRYEEAGSVRYASMPYFRVPARVLEKAEELVDWARTSIAIAHSQPKKKG